MGHELEVLWRFLRPGGLSWFFLVAIISVFTYGFYRSRAYVGSLNKSLGDAARAYRGGRGDSVRHGVQEASTGSVQSGTVAPCWQMEPLAYLRLHLHEDDYHDRRIEVIPEILVSIGILGTFVGLGLAITQVDFDMLSGEGADVGAVVGQLRVLLGHIGLKFQVSAYGIVAALLFQLVVRRYHEEVEHALELQALAMLDDYMPASRVLAESVGKLADAAQSIATTADSFSKDAKMQGKALVDASKQLSGLGNSINKTMEAFKRDLEKVFTDHFDNLAHKTNDTMDAVNNSLTEMANNSQGVAEATGGVRGALEVAMDVNVDLKQKLDKLADVLSRLDSTVIALKDASAGTSSDSANPADAGS